MRSADGQCSVSRFHCRCYTAVGGVWDVGNAQDASHAGEACDREDDDAKDVNVANHNVPQVNQRAQGRAVVQVKAGGAKQVGGMSVDITPCCLCCKPQWSSTHLTSTPMEAADSSIADLHMHGWVHQ